MVGFSYAPCCSYIRVLECLSLLGSFLTSYPGIVPAPARGCKRSSCARSGVRHLQRLLTRRPGWAQAGFNFRYSPKVPGTCSELLNRNVCAPPYLGGARFSMALGRMALPPAMVHWPGPADSSDQTDQLHSQALRMLPAPADWAHRGWAASRRARPGPHPGCSWRLEPDRQR